MRLRHPKSCGLKFKPYLKEFREPLKDHDPKPVALVIGVHVLEEGVQVFDVAPPGLGIFRDDVNHDVTGSFLDRL